MITKRQDMHMCWLEIDAGTYFYEPYELSTLKKGNSALVDFKHLPESDLYQFDITNLLPLSDYLHRGRYSPDQMYEVFKSVLRGFYQLCRSMLSPERIQLKSNSIFITPDFQIKLLYLPYSKCNEDFDNGDLICVRAKDELCALLKAVFPFLTNEITGSLEPEEFLERLLLEIEGHGKRPEKVMEVISEPLVKKVSINRNQVIAVLLLLLAQVISIGLFTIAYNVLLKLTGEEVEVFYSLLTCALGIDLLLCYLVLKTMRVKGKEVMKKEKKSVPVTLKTMIEPKGIDVSLDTVFLKKQSREIWFLIRDNGVEFELQGDEILIGRNASIVQWCLDEPEIGRRHARLEQRDKQVFIEDMGSKNGTFVNGQDIRNLGRCSLSDGDELMFSHLKFFLRLKESGDF